MARFRNVCFTLNNPEGEIPFDPERMSYLVYQEEVGESGTYHFQGYCEFKTALVASTVKALLGGDQMPHIERRNGSALQAASYAKKEDTRVGDVFEYGEISSQGKRIDLQAFKDAVMDGKRKRDLIDDHVGIIARYPKFYDTLTMLNRPSRSAGNPLSVTLLYGQTGLGKTRSVIDRFGDDDDFYIAPLNNGTMWYDTFDGHKRVLLDDFSGSSSHISLCSLLRLLDRYPVLVPTKGSHTWWLPSEVYLTTNVLPKDWYKWDGRPEQYRALARRFTRVVMFYERISDTDPGQVEQEATWWKENAPAEAVPLYF